MLEVPDIRLSNALNLDISIENEPRPRLHLGKMDRPFHPVLPPHVFLFQWLAYGLRVGI